MIQKRCTAVFLKLLGNFGVQKFCPFSKAEAEYLMQNGSVSELCSFWVYTAIVLLQMVVFFFLAQLFLLMLA